MNMFPITGLLNVNKYIKYISLFVFQSFMPVIRDRSTGGVSTPHLEFKPKLRGGGGVWGEK